MKHRHRVLSIVGAITLLGMALAAPPGAAQTGVPRVVSFTLIDASDGSNNGAELGTIQDGDLINLALLPTRQLNIRANTSPERVGSVEFNFDFTPGFPERVLPVEEVFPYTLGRDFPATNYLAFDPPLQVGSHRLGATPFTERGGGGTPGESLFVSLRVIDELPVGAREILGALERRFFNALADETEDLERRIGDLEEIVADLTGPTFTWQESWDVNLVESRNGIGNFGESAGQKISALRDLGVDGDIGPATVVARAKGSQEGGTGSALDGMDVNFFRTFRLEGSPSGWTIRLEGGIKGELGAGGKRSTTIYLGFVSVVEGITRELSLGNNVVELLFGGGLDGPGVAGEILTEEVNESGIDEIHVPDGVYTVAGRHRAWTITEGSLVVTHGFANANFFDASDDAGFRVTISATPIQP